MGFEPVFLKNFTSEDIETVNNVTKMYNNYEKIIEELKEKINKNK